VRRWNANRARERTGLAVSRYGGRCHAGQTRRAGEDAPLSLSRKKGEAAVAGARCAPDDPVHDELAVVSLSMRTLSLPCFPAGGSADRLPGLSYGQVKITELGTRMNGESGTSNRNGCNCGRRLFVVAVL